MCVSPTQHSLSARSLGVACERLSLNVSLYKEFDSSYKLNRFSDIVELKCSDDRENVLQLEVTLSRITFTLRLSQQKISNILLILSQRLIASLLVKDKCSLLALRHSQSCIAVIC